MGKIKNVVGGVGGAVLGGPIGAIVGSNPKSAASFVLGPGAGEYNQMIDQVAPNMARPTRPTSADLEKRLGDLTTLNKQQATDSINQQSGSQYQEAISNLAQKGGLRGGAAERLEQANMRGQQNALQGIQSQGMQQNANNRLAAFGLDKEYYDTDMREWAANQMARANMEQGRGKGQRGGFLNQTVGRITGK